jgi:hypothetical protein
MSKLVLCTVALAIVVGSVTSSTAQETKTQKVNAAKTGEKKSDATRVSADGFNAMRAMHDARVAIFNGDPQLCEELLNKANEALVMASKDEAVAKVKTDLIAIDGSLALADTFVPSEKKAGHVAKANEHFKKGESEKGIEQLKLGEIDVNFSRVLMPLEATKKRLADAASLAKEHKYYESNLALKAAEDGLELDSVSLVEFPNTDGKVEKKVENKGKK